MFLCIAVQPKGSIESVYAVLVCAALPNAALASLIYWYKTKALLECHVDDTYYNDTCHLVSTIRKTFEAATGVL